MSDSFEEAEQALRELAEEAAKRLDEDSGTNFADQVASAAGITEEAARQFSETDEDPNKVFAAFDSGPKSVTENPNTVSSDEEVALRHAVAEASKLFDEMCKDRHEYGQQKYSEFSYVEAPTLQMALEEIADLSNYARYTFIKVWLIRGAIERAQVSLMQKAGGSTGGFISTSDVLGVKGR
jgi:hypothetical protein